MMTEIDIQEMKVITAPAVAPALLKQAIVDRVGYCPFWLANSRGDWPVIRVM
jgi:hypothetical protein